MDGLLDTALVEVSLDQPTQQLVAFGVHHRLQLTMSEPLVFLIAEVAQKRLKLRKRIRVVLDRAGRDCVRCHRRGLLG